MKRLALSLVVLASAVASLSLPAPSAQAVTGSDWQAGHIIDDQVFFDGNALSVQQIQAFLTSKVPTCDTNGNQPYYGTYKGVTYNGNVLRRNLDPAFPGPFTCVKDYVENPTTHENNIGRPGANIPGGLSAAQILYQEAQAYSISPKVLLTLIQKEAKGSILTDDWPWPDQYVTPTGFGCPDSAACNSTYYGFYNQVHMAARQFRIYTNNPNSYNYGVGANSIRYRPDPSSCGMASVTIVNQATANLYIYTPYTPNQAALNNLYGTGDGCSSYGNRNFWRIFNDWFGSTYTPSYASRYVSQSAYPTVIQGQSATVSLTYKNAGSNTWYDDTTSGAAGVRSVRLATSHALNRSSAVGSSWGGDRNRASGLFSAVLKADGSAYATNPHAVAPGESATFTFTVSAAANLAPGTYREFFQPIVEGVTSMNDPWTFIDVQVTPQVYASAYAGQSAYPNLIWGQTGAAYLRYRNAGNMPWHDDTTAGAAGVRAVRLATSHNINRRSVVATPRGGFWCNNGDANRAACTFGAVYEADGATLASNQHAAQPGQIVQFNVPFSAYMLAPGTYREFFQPILEGITTMNDPWTFLDVIVRGGSYSSQYYSESGWPTMARGATASGFMSYRNTGTLPWYDTTSGPALGMPLTRLATTHNMNRSSNVANVTASSWCNNPDRNRAACVFSAVYLSDGTTLAPDQHVVQPGQIAKFNLSFAAAATQTPGTYREFFQPIVEGVTTMNDPWTFLDVIVTP